MDPSPTVAAPPSPGALEPGALLQGTYRIAEKLAVGGMGEVYAASHERLSGRFAVKVLQRDLALNEEAFARFAREASIMSGLQHPHIAHIVDFNLTEDGAPYLVMELLGGRDLQQTLEEGKPLPLARVAAIVRQIASALDAAHSRGVIHRDLKPENVILLQVAGNEAFVKVIDFGISKVLWSSTRLTQESAVLGTPQYMAPEQAQGRIEAIDHRTDQFALAAMTYAMVTGREAFRGETPVAVLYQVVHAEPAPIADLVEWPSDAVEEVLRRGLAKQPESRYDSVLEFSRALDEAVASVLADSGKIPVGVVSGVQSAGDTGELIAIAAAANAAGRRRRRWPYVALALMALAAGGAAVGYRYAPPIVRETARAQAAAAYRVSSAGVSRAVATVRQLVGR